MFRRKIALSLLLIWLFALIVTIETKSPVFEIIMPLVMTIFVIYMLVWTLITIFAAPKKIEEENEE